MPTDPHPDPTSPAAIEEKKRPWPLSRTLACAGLALYAPALGRWWTSEDFLILRRLGDGPFLETALAQWTGPWLGVDLVSFYRPLSSFFLQVEHALFGQLTFLYLLLHLLLHGINTWQVRQIARGLVPPADDSSEALDTYWLVAAIFAFYPLHPNSVLFVASFATLYSTLFLLMAVRWHLEDRQGPTLLAFALALACYEQAAVLPILLLLLDLLRFGQPPPTPTFLPGRSWLPWVRRHSPAFVLLGAYLLLRRSVLGHAVGGYSTFRERLAAFDPAELLGSVLHGLVRLVLPVYRWPLPEIVLWGGALVLLIALAFCLRHRNNARARLGLLAAGWILASQAPFTFVGVVPGNGRYVYLAAVGLALAWSAILPRRATSGRRAWILSAVMVVYGLLLVEVVSTYRQAGQLTRKIQREVVKVADTDDGEGAKRRLFVAGVPKFLEIGGVPAAQVFHWGFADAFLPPFHEESGLEVYPLPPLGDGALRPLAQAGGRSLRWQSRTPTWGTVEPIRLPPKALAPIDVTFDVSASGDALHWRAQRGTQDRLFVLTRGGYHLEKLPFATEPQDHRIELPAPWLRSMAILYPGSPNYAWVERRNRDGELLALSELVTLEPLNAHRRGRGSPTG